jgi:adenylate kinase family enzyme
LSRPPQRIAIVGLAAAGKTTLAAALAEKIAGRHIELDQLHWEANWTPATREVFRARVADAVKADAWATDGNYSVVRDLVWTRADLIIWLDYSLPCVYARLLRRTARRLWTQEKICNGNVEHVRTNLFSRDSLFVYNWHAISRHREIYAKLLSEQTSADVVRLRTPAEAATWLSRFKHL